MFVRWLLLTKCNSSSIPIVPLSGLPPCLSMSGFAIQLKSPAKSMFVSPGLYCHKEHSPPQSLGIMEVNKIFSKYCANILNLHEVCSRSRGMMVRWKWRKALPYNVFKMVSHFFAKSVFDYNSSTSS